MKTGTKAGIAPFLSWNVSWGRGFISEHLEPMALINLSGAVLVSDSS